MRLPQFIVIGAAKAGTTTLYDYLCRHPNICMSKAKEPTYFSEDARYARGVSWYASLFEGARPDQICGEASTNYTQWPVFPEAARRMVELLPSVKLIYIMRHPVDRAYSHYAELIRGRQRRGEQRNVEESFEESLERGSRVLHVSDYMRQIEQYLAYYPRKAFLFLLLEDLKTDVEGKLAQTCRFVGVDGEVDLVRGQVAVANASKDQDRFLVRSRVTAPLKKVPGMARVASWMPQAVRDRIYHGVLGRLPQRKRIEREYLPPPMLPETRARLIEHFRAPNQKLADFLGRDLSAWDH